MSEYNKTILTNEGIDLARRANKGTATFSLTRGVSSTDNLSGKTVEELQNLTKLPSIQQSVKLSDVGDTSDNSDTVLGVRMTFDNQNLKTGYNVHTVGIYAKEPDKNEILYGIATAKTPEYIPDFGEQTLFKFDFLMYLVIGRTDKVTVEVSPDDVYRKKEVYSKSEVDTAVAKLDKKDAETVKSLNDYKLENSTYHTNFEKSVTDRLGTKADKTTVEQQLGTKADKSNTYTKDEVNSKVAPKADKGYVDSELNKKADKATTYTKTEVDNKIAGQVKSVNGHTANASGAVTLPTLKAKVLTGYDVKNKTATFDNNAHFDANGVFSRWPVDQGVIGQLADAINAKLPIEAGNPNGDLLDHAGNKIEYWNGNGQNVKNLPPMGTNKKWYFAIKLVGPGGWGSVTVIDQDGTYWLNTRNDVWTGWKSITTNETLKRVKFVKQSLDQNGNIFQDTKFVTQEADGTYKINIFDSDWTAYKVAWLLKNTKSYSIENNTDLNNVKNTGFYNAAGTSGLKNSPVSAWFSMSVNANQWNGQQTLYDTNSGQLYVRTWNPTRFTDWQIIANAGDLTNQSITSITDYDVASEGWHNTQVGKFDPSGHFSNFLVDAGALKPIAEAINNLNTNLTTMQTELMNLEKRTDYNTPQGEFNNTTVNLNNLRSTGMYRLSNCYVQSGPYPTNNAHWVYVKVTVFDVNTVFQTLYEGDNMYGRKSYSTTNWGQWHQYLNKTV
ncbi:pyocin knob domain-containing protein [Lactobacillus gasseri]|uniref:pyocin knob domain-containing protein n=2 Tax=Bacillati TaxID=1783272 RepID=UPI0025505CAE|nr:hypothetical protein [Lactobacillus gasseri]MDK6500679.1 hypothetical protein [Lactobacillus gasseri]